ncbi:MAG: tetraacyldisaccharide 4'-kinase [Bacteroidetes bacterium]|nr:tetraacyldisaccharide 4'-kinase [Bacteroidota bacterium]
MVQSILAKILLAPFSLLYGLGVSLRDFFYRKELLKAVEFNIPIISVGNLSIGGAGKTPHVEYLVRVLKDYIHIATLSRGYKRKTKGFLSVHKNSTAEQVGDEPLQYKRKFPGVQVAVAESRTFAIPKMLMDNAGLQLVLLDDAFQHRSIKPGLNILLTEYGFPFTKDYLLPSGRLREWRSAYKRADIIIVSKCPMVMDEQEAEVFREEINPFPDQQLYFSFYDYFPPYYIFNPSYRITLEKDLDVLLICAIAGTDYLVSYLEEQVNRVTTLEYEDHHYFSKYDVSHLRTTFERMDSKKKIIVTTEKDAMRLELHKTFLMEHNLPVFALPLKVQFHFNQGELFDQQVKDYMLNFKA